MTIWVILSWVLVVVLTTINVVVFLKLKKASDQMMKMAFPNAKNMGDAMTQMQGMMQGLGGMNRGGGNANAQMKMAMDMLQKMQQGGGPGKRR